MRLQNTPIEPGPPILAAGVSPDGRMLTLQRLPQHLEFVSRDSPNMFLQVWQRGCGGSCMHC